MKVFLVVIATPLIILIWIARMLAAGPFLFAWMALVLTGQEDSPTADRLGDIAERIVWDPR